MDNSAAYTNKFSSGLKDRLKRCGRYHASPVAKQSENQKQLSCQQEQKSVTDAREMKENCGDAVQMLPTCKSHSATSGLDQRSGVSLEQVKCKTSKGLGCIASSDSMINSPVYCESYSESKDKAVDSVTTPSTHKSRSKFMVKGSKLNFSVPTCSNDTMTQVESCKPRDDSENSTSVEKETCRNEQMSDMSVKISLEKELSKQEDVLGKLKMVKMYRNKNNLTELQSLINKWRDVSQQALQDLHDSMPEPKPTLTELINHLGIDHSLVHFNSEEDETFS